MPEIEYHYLLNSYFNKFIEYKCKKATVNYSVQNY